MAFPSSHIHGDAVIIGAGASGLMCAMEASRRGRQIIVIDHGPEAGRKIVISGGGRCNFTNLNMGAGYYLSRTPHFCTSALSRYTPLDIVAFLEQHGITWEERAHGQLFSTQSARNIRDLLVRECRHASVRFFFNASIKSVSRSTTGTFSVQTHQGDFYANALVVATGGRSFPETGASGIGYAIARQFGLWVHPQRPGLAPLILGPADQAVLSPLSGIAGVAEVRTDRHQFRDNLLFTHRGLSGPAILQISSYWQPGTPIRINLLPDLDLSEILNTGRKHHPQRQAKSILADFLPRRLVAARMPPWLINLPLQHLSRKQIQEIVDAFQKWNLTPESTGGYRTAEVTVGGVDGGALSSQTLMARQVPGLFFIGEVVDVTGWLGGYNLQWAWSSGWAAGQAI